MGARTTRAILAATCVAVLCGCVSGGSTPAANAPAASAPAAASAAQGNAAIVERLPQVVACTPTPRATLMGSGPGQEMFSVICTNGHGLVVQCVSGTCKVMN